MSDPFPLFQNNALSQGPLAYQLAPKTLEALVGQSHLLGPGKPLRKMMESDTLISMILWGPPGCGKTSLSRLISQMTNAHYLALNAVTANVAAIKEAVQTAQTQRVLGKRTILFIDEIHRFNKTQQDALLPEVESGLITLVGATTENPFFHVIPALVSRCQIFELMPLATDALGDVLARAWQTLDTMTELPESVSKQLIAFCGGDARKLINCTELLSKLADGNPVTAEMAQDCLRHYGVGYSDDDHYDLISAYIKSLRGSDPDAALYWLARLLAGGETPEFIVRRMIIFASEDIGNADPQALVLATSLLQVVKFIGMPEAQINLGHVTTYLALAPKSNASYMAIKRAMDLVKSGVRYPVPNHLKDSHYKGASKMGYGKGYQYPHDFPYAMVNQSYMPEPHLFYEPKEMGTEKQLKIRLDWIKKNRGGS